MSRGASQGLAELRPLPLAHDRCHGGRNRGNDRRGACHVPERLVARQGKTVLAPAAGAALAAFSISFFCSSMADFNASICFCCSASCAFNVATSLSAVCGAAGAAGAAACPNNDVPNRIAEHRVTLPSVLAFIISIPDWVFQDFVPKRGGEFVTALRRIAPVR